LRLLGRQRTQSQERSGRRAWPHAGDDVAQVLLCSRCYRCQPNNAIAVRLKMTKQTVGKWRTRSSSDASPGYTTTCAWRS
jgi:putative transposase